MIKTILFFSVSLFLFGCLSFQKERLIIDKGNKIIIVHAISNDSLIFENEAIVFNNSNYFSVLRISKPSQLSDFNNDWNLRILCFKADKSKFLIKTKQNLSFKNESNLFLKRLEDLSFVLNEEFLIISVKGEQQKVSLRRLNYKNTKEVLEKVIRKIIEKEIRILE